MGHIRKKIETIMASEDDHSLFGMSLSALSVLYGGVVRLRAMLYEKGIFKSRRLPRKVISVGNLTAGGTGKTPMTLCLATLLTRLGWKVAVISRGYKGQAEKTCGIVSDGQTLFMGPDVAGDEPFMMAKTLKNIPVIVGQNRFEAGALAVTEFKPDVIVLDDAFQHLRLERDIDLVLLDRRQPFGNGCLLPRGPLREPLSALFRADAFILTRSDLAESPHHISLPGPVFKSSHEPYIYKVIPREETDVPDFGNSETRNAIHPELLKGQSVFAFSGIARNSDFRDMIEALGAMVAGFAEFPDHHRYSDHDFDMILGLAKKTCPDVLVTTEKDHARMTRKIPWPFDLVVIGIKMSFEDEENFSDFIETCLTRPNAADGHLSR